MYLITLSQKNTNAICKYSTCETHDRNRKILFLEKTEYAIYVMLMKLQTNFIIYLNAVTL